MHDIEILPYGDSALLINFEQQISVEINRQVLALNENILRQQWPFIEFTIPAYCSLTVGIKRDLATLESATGLIDGLLSDQSQLPESPIRRIITVPAIFDEPSAPDQDRVCRHTRIAWDTFIGQMLKIEFHVFMIGFIAGFPYMGPLPEGLRCPRLSTPRVRVPAGSIAIAENQCGIYPVDSPGGWNIIGITPVPLLNANHGDFLFAAGDIVRFREVTQQEFDHIRALSDNGSYKSEIEHG